MKALVLTPATKHAEVREVPRPTPGAGELLVRVHGIALNPVDALYTAHPLATQEQRVLGVDFAGEVVEMSDDISNTRIAKGTRVAGFLQGACSANERPGAFAEYLVVPHDLVWPIPQGVTYEAAAAVNMCGMTAAQGVFERLGMPCPFYPTPVAKQGPVTVLVYGASTSLGMYAAQLVHASAAYSGQKITLVGVASQRMHGFLKAPPYAYDVLVDYRDADWAAQVREATGGVDYAFDSISEGATVAQIQSTLKADAKMVVCRNPPGGWANANGQPYVVTPVYGAVWDALGEDVVYHRGVVIPARPEGRAFGAEFYAWLGGAVDDGIPRLEPNPLRHMPGGLERVPLDGFELLGYGDVGARAIEGCEEEWMRPISGEKLVYTVA